MNFDRVDELLTLLRFSWISKNDWKYLFIAFIIHRVLDPILQVNVDSRTLEQTVDCIKNADTPAARRHAFSNSGKIRIFAWLIEEKVDVHAAIRSRVWGAK